MSAETIIGAVVVAVAALFIVFAYMRTGSGSLSGYEIQARLPRVDGLGIGTDVRLSGIKIGSVSDLTLDPQELSRHRAYEYPRRHQDSRRIPP